MAILRRDYHGIVQLSSTGTLAHLELGRTYAFATDMAKTRTAYQDLFGRGKDVDPDIPILRGAQPEYADLK